MSLNPSRRADSLPDPEELPADAAAFPGGILAYGLIAYCYVSLLPLWQPLTWWLLVVVVGVLRIWVIKHTDFDALSERHRRWLLRSLIWMFMGAISSATYFIYVPNNVGMQSFLSVCLLGTAIVLISHSSGFDVVRVVVALAILAIPNAIHLIFEGIVLNEKMSWVMGCCTLLMPIPLVQITLVQSRLMRSQLESRLQAEQAAKAMTAVALAKSRFFAAISHDLRQPVHAIGLYLDAVERVVAESASAHAKHALIGITVSWQTLNDLLSKVLDLARLEANMETPDLCPLPLAPLLQDVVLQHSSIAERKGVRLVVLSKPDAVVNADELMLKRVLSNLLGNALKFAPAGSAVVIAVRRTKDNFRIQVRDAGCGIAEEDQAHIFSEFVQINNQERDPSQGLGLGLAIAKRLTELLGGIISVRSRAGAGCCMTVTLPRHLPDPQFTTGQSRAIDTTQPEVGIYQSSLAGQRILLVEDDHLVGDGMVHLLQSWGSHVVWEQTAAAARQHVNECEIAICDVRLPNKESGLDLARWFQTLGIRVALITGETDLASRQFAAEHNILLLTKPISPKELKAALENLVSASSAN